MICQSVRSDNGDREGKWVGLSIVFILLLAAVLLPYHQANNAVPTLKPHQIWITDLSADELGLVAELRLAHEEIRNLNQDSREFEAQERWPTMTELFELWLPPFVEDKSWERKGRHQWAQIMDTVYQGIRQDAQGASSVVLNSSEPHPDIWLALSAHTKPLTLSESQPFQSQLLIDRGWTQIVFTNDSEALNHSH